jgi:undecaprenyl-diphosphatase
LILLVGAYLGSNLLSHSIRALTERARPPAILAIGRFPGFSFPSGHTTEATAVYGVLAAIVAVNTASWRHKVAAWTVAVSIAALVGLSRLYLGAHWLTDVSGGWALGALWLALLLGTARATSELRSPSRSSLPGRSGVSP